MTGLDKIVNQILDDAGKEASQVMEKAQAEAVEILSAAREACEELAAGNDEKIEEAQKSHIERIQSSAQLQKRQAVLKAKQELIAKVIDKAYSELCKKDGDEYFTLIKKMLEKFALARSGEVYFSEKDLERMPEGFEDEIKTIAAAKGGSLSLAKEPKELDGGFILVYGGVEENCSFKALISAKKDELADKVHQLIFA